MDPLRPKLPPALEGLGLVQVCELIPHPAYLADAEGRVLYVNRRWSAYTGLPFTESLELRGGEALHPDDREAVYAAYLRAVDRQTPFEHRHRLRRRDGEYCWGLSRAEPVHVDGRVVAWVGTFTGLDPDAGALAPARALPGVAEVLDSLEAQVVVLDAEGRVVAVNRAWREFAGAGGEGCLGRDYLEVCARANGLDAEGVAQVAAHVRAVLGGGSGPFRLEYPCPTSRGERWLALTVRPLAGGHRGAVVLLEDVTGYRQAEAASAHLAAIVTSSTDAIASKTLEGIVTSWNASAERILGYSAREMVGQSIRRIIPPERQHEEDMILARIRAGERVEHYETVRLTKDGRRIDISLTVSPVRDASGRIIGASKVARDITERKRAEQALRESEERYRELSEAQKRFVNDAAHELRAPLTAIVGNLQLLARFKNMRKADREEALAEVTREAARLSRLVNDMLALARGDAGLRLRLGPVRLDEVLREAFATARVLGKDHRMERGHLPEAWVTGDADRLKQLALQLLENAVKYTPAGGTVRLELDLGEGYAELRVRDTGIGIAPEDLPHVFERFYRADRARSRAVGGSGLGLSIAQWIAEQHGGGIRLESEVGKGTVAVVRLPLAPDAPRDR
ncbi:PAS domain-containing sensor histidine kinase [Meiothermus rufus]|uniref:PAS domain-containing sensor histidine kinase n=1 Tax=Meiothermus rufus TaxID=604332 RepID=UPI000684F32D|nr:PAS domain S-box protein [Meiothermus rufus]